jgi:hypothetical protein
MLFTTNNKVISEAICITLPFIPSLQGREDNVTHVHVARISPSPLEGEGNL